MSDDLFEDMTSDPLAPGAPLPKRTWRRHYTTVPDFWKRRLQTARHPAATYALALELLYRFWQNGQEPVVVSTDLARVAGLSRRSKFNALAQLERLGLIQVERERRKSPRVVLLHTLKR